MVRRKIKRNRRKAEPKLPKYGWTVAIGFHQSRFSAVRKYYWIAAAGDFVFNSIEDRLAGERPTFDTPRQAQGAWVRFTKKRRIKYWGDWWKHVALTRETEDLLDMKN